jgi:hypothetical protein
VRLPPSRSGARRFADHPLATLALAALGVASGHVVTYFVLVPSATARDVLLARTGHGYFAGFAQAALVIGAIGAAVVVLGVVGGGSAAGRPAFGLLARLQVVAFVGMEVAERVVSRAGFHDLFTAELVVGVALQVAVAVALAWLVARLCRAARAFVRAPCGRQARPIDLVRSRPDARTRRSVVLAAWAPRAPPFVSPSVAA